MSYILDALNKAERERGGKRMSVLRSAHEFRAMRGNRMWLITGVLVVCTAATIWLFFTTHLTVSRTPNPAATGAAQNRAGERAETEKPEEPIVPDAASRVNSPSDLPAAALSAPSKGVPVSPDLKPGDASTPARAPEITGVRQEIGAGKTATDKRQPGQLPQDVAAPQQVSPAPQALPPSESVPPQAQPTAMPAAAPAVDAPSTPSAVENRSVSLREALDKMTISVLMYAEAKSERRVYINGRKYIEGDYVDGRYLVESITLEGVVLSYEGERALLRSGPK